MAQLESNSTQQRGPLESFAAPNVTPIDASSRSCGAKNKNIFKTIIFAGDKNQLLDKISVPC